VGPEAALAAALFALTLFGLSKKQKWAPILAIVITVTQRVFATYVFFPSPAIAITNLEFSNNLLRLQRHKNSKRAPIITASFLTERLVKPLLS
jgi:hypothetical protein